MLKDDLNNREFTGKVLTSAGIGKQYFERDDWKFNKYNKENTREYYVFKNGTRAMMPKISSSLSKMWNKVLRK